MNYENFIAEVKSRVECLCPEACVAIEKVVKNNSLTLDGIVIRREGECLTPTIYLNGMYGEYHSGKTLDDIVEEIISIDKNQRMKCDVDPDYFCNFEQVKGNIYAKLINYEKNEELLKRLPYRKFLDLAIIYYGVFDGFSDGVGMWNITNDVLKGYSIDEEVLYQNAMNNTIKEQPYFIKTMMELLGEIMPEEEYLQYVDEDMVVERRSPMYVMSNEDKIFGAITVLYPGVLNGFYEKHGDFYVLPSSVHEVILIPVSEGIEEKELQSMVVEVNRTALKPEEFLSDNVYIYEGDKNKLRKLIKLT